MVPALAAALLLATASWLAWQRSANPAGETAMQDGLPSILVPPFHTLNAADLWLGAGLASDVEGALTGLRALGVRPWSLRGPSVVLPAASQAPTDDAAAVSVSRRLQTDYVLVGEIESQVARMEIAVRLLRVRDGTPVWSGIYWRDSASLPAFPSELSLAVAEALHVVPSPCLAVALDPEHRRDPAAYHWYLEGLARRGNEDPAGVRQAPDLFRRATVRDPGFASAWVALAEALEHVADRGSNLSKTDTAEWRRAAERGVAFDSLNGEAFLRRAMARTAR